MKGSSICFQPLKSSAKDVVHSSDASPWAPPSLISKAMVRPVFCPSHQKRMPRWADQSWAGSFAAKSWVKPP
ncbi:hypothetical protein GCM10018783_32070 [Streptomyces griseosporeus]|nr:hypothetical protein GCM10018783_32070 [Streptomyces griseosporeus]